ncbi:stalk domain-containing protein [Ferviditalea candida]|uniref:Stalk domain-containing protein n=1 Tax=Ferviditalea candida TaxID=3108399 RepID=A0ABU5ZK85_9BACL|nr:stalk domain-containing protein [Paenibacillaceae bacterium T2]
MRYTCSVLLLVVLTIMPGTIWAATPQPTVASGIAVQLDGIKLQFRVAPILEKGTTLAPMREIFEAHGASIAKWDNRTKTVTAVKNQREIIYTIGRTEAIINGGTYAFSSVPGRLVNGSVLIPLRFISESLGATVEYDVKSRTVMIRGAERDWGSASPEVFAGYRLTLPYQRMMQHAPYFLSYVRQNQTRDSFVFFGDSTTWGSYLGRTQTLPYLFGQRTGHNSYNLGVPGFTSSHMVPFLKYALRDIRQPTVVVELQTFWGASQDFTGLSELLKGTIPDYSAALAYLRKDMSRDDETMTPPYADYSSQSKERIAASIGRGKSLFSPKKTMDDELNRRLTELRDFIANRPDQSFALYVPPYQTAEIYKYTDLTPAGLEAYVNQMKTVFDGMSNVRFADFNRLVAGWQQADFVDWLYLSAAGERKFAERMQKWLSES